MARMFTVGELAELMGVDAETIRRWRYRGRNGVFLECLVGQGKQGHRITAEALKRFLEVNPGLVTEALREALNEGQEEAVSEDDTRKVERSLRVYQQGDSDTVAVLKSILDEKCSRRELLEQEILRVDREIHTLVRQIQQELERGEAW